MIKKLYRFLYHPQAPAPFLNPVYYELDESLSDFRRRLLGCLPAALKKKSMRLVMLERLVETPFVYLNLKLAPGARVLDFGCAESRIPLELASLGYKVTGADLRPYGFSHPNLEFSQGDFLHNRLPAESFDAVICLSSIEHVGIGVYGSAQYAQGDARVMAEFRRLLKPGGRLLLTVPYGRKMVKPTERIYDEESLGELLKGWRVETRLYCKGLGRRQWVPASKDELSEISGMPYAQAVALTAAVK